MISLQVISRILDSKDLSFINDCDIEITPDYFDDYKDEYNFINDHYIKYGSVPDVETFIARFPDITLVEVDEDNDYLVDELKREYAHNRMIDVWSKGTSLIKDNKTYEAYDFIISELPKYLEQVQKSKDVGIIESIDSRVYNYEFVNQNQSANFIPTGFDEIDTDIVGWQRGEELVVFYARTNQGKSWVLEAVCTHAVEQGYRVGYFSPEMSANDIGYRFDTLHGNLSNAAMKFGRATDEFNLDIYKKYSDDLKKLNGELYVSTPAYFSRKVTISKLRNWINKRHLDMLAIDGITYLTDERFKKGDSKTVSLTNISEDLMNLSSELKIPILVVVQANRGGVVDKTSLDTPELENIRDSDGIAMNASKVYAVRQLRVVNDDGETVTLLIENKKMRGLKVGQSYSYVWDIDVVRFKYIDKENIDLSTDKYEAPKITKEPTAGKRQKRDKQNEDDF